MRACPPRSPLPAALNVATWKRAGASREASRGEGAGGAEGPRHGGGPGAEGGPALPIPAPSCPKDAGFGLVEGFLHGLGVGRKGAEVVLPCALFEPR